MSVHFFRELEDLKRSLLGLCAMVEAQVHDAVRALLDRDEELTYSVERRDRDVDHREIEIEEECLKILALYQPVAGDLRLIVAALKINNDLERIGDLAVNIARKARALTHLPSLTTPFDLGGMSGKTQSMLHDSLDALVNLDANLAKDVCKRDDAVDKMKREIRVSAEEMIQQNPENTQAMLRIIAVARNLERIADCATNIAEDVIYMTEGGIVRHHESA